MDPVPKTIEELKQEAADELAGEANTAQILRETQGEYVEVFTDANGRRYYKSKDDIGEDVNTYLADGEEPPKKGDPNLK